MQMYRREDYLVADSNVVPGGFYPQVFMPLHDLLALRVNNTCNLILKNTIQQR